MAKKELEILLKATRISKSFGDFVANQNIDNYYYSRQGKSLKT